MIWKRNAAGINRPIAVATDEKVIAMGNASDDLKAISEQICGHVAEDGIYYFCKENNLI